MAPHVHEEFDRRRRHHGHPEGHRGQGHERGPQGRGVRGGLELSAVDHEEDQHPPGDQRLLDVGPGDDVQQDGPGQEHHGHTPGAPLAAQDAAAQRDEGEAGHGHQGAGGHAGPQRQVLLEHVEASAERQGDGVQDVDDPGDEDGGGPPPADPPGAAVGLAQVGGGRPRGAHGIGGGQGGVERPADPAPCDDALEAARGRQLVVGQQQADVQLGAGLHLDPAHPLAVQEDRGQAESPPVLGDHLGRGPHVGVEPGAQVGELGLERGGGDEAGVAPGDEPPGVVPRRVVGPGVERTSSRAPPPRIDHMRRLSRPSTTARTASTTADAPTATASWSWKSAKWAWRRARAGRPEPRCRRTHGVTAMRSRRATPKGTSNHQA